MSGGGPSTDNIDIQFIRVAFIGEQQRPGRTCRNAPRYDVLTVLGGGEAVAAQVALGDLVSAHAIWAPRTGGTSAQTVGDDAERTGPRTRTASYAPKQAPPDHAAFIAHHRLDRTRIHA